jgi:hypothetical protein
MAGPGYKATAEKLIERLSVLADSPWTYQKGVCFRQTPERCRIVLAQSRESQWAHEVVPELVRLDIEYGVDEGDRVIGQLAGHVSWLERNLPEMQRTSALRSPQQWYKLLLWLQAAALQDPTYKAAQLRKQRLDPSAYLEAERRAAMYLQGKGLTPYTERNSALPPVVSGTRRPVCA